MLGMVGVLAACSAGDAADCRSSAAGYPLPAAQIEQEVQGALKEFVDALNAGDVSRVLAAYERSPRVTSASIGQIARGWEAVRVSADSSLPANAGRYAVSVGSIDVMPVGFRHALAVAPVVLTTSDGVHQVRGAISTLFERDSSNVWRLLHDHTSLAPKLLAGPGRK